MAQLAERQPGTHRAPGSIPSTAEAECAVHTHLHPRTLEVDAEGSVVQGYPLLHSRLKGSLGYVTLCLKRPRERRLGKERKQKESQQNLAG